MPAPRRTLLALSVALAAAGCAPRPLLERAVRARGGALHSVMRSVEAEVTAGFPGTWQWRTAFLTPDRYAWSMVTAAGVDHYLFDGAVVRAFVGGRAVATDVSPEAPLRIQSRFAAVTNLDAVLDGGATVTPLPAGDLPAGVAAGASVVLSGARYRLGFDERMLLVWATGPFDLPPLGGGELTARYDDYRPVEGLLLPFRVTYELGGRPLGVERTRHLCPNEPALTAASFASPDRLPPCGGP